MNDLQKRLCAELVAIAHAVHNPHPIAPVTAEELREFDDVLNVIKRTTPVYETIFIHSTSKIAPAKTLLLKLRMRLPDTTFDLTKKEYTIPKNKFTRHLTDDDRLHLRLTYSVYGVLMDKCDDLDLKYAIQFNTSRLPKLPEIELTLTVHIR